MLTDPANLKKLVTLLRYSIDRCYPNGLSISPPALSQHRAVLHEFGLLNVNVQRLTRRELLFCYDLIVGQTKQLLRGEVVNRVLQPIPKKEQETLLTNIKATGLIEPTITAGVGGIQSNPFRTYKTTMVGNKIVIEPGLRISVGTTTLLLINYFKNQ